MRKSLIALALMFFMTGLVIATDVTVLSYDPDKKELKVKDGDKEHTYKISDKVKITFVDKNGENPMDGKFEDVEKRLKAIKPDSKFMMKMDITTDKETITEIKTRKGGKGKQ